MWLKLRMFPILEEYSGTITVFEAMGLISQLFFLLVVFFLETIELNLFSCKIYIIFTSQCGVDQ